MAGTYSRARARPLLAAWALSLACLPAAAAETVQSLRYGVTLYHLYQQSYFDALSELMVGQSLDQLGPHGENAELLRGGIALSYGMDREAERVFARLLDQPREGVDRGRAWFYLAKLAWQRGDVQRAAAALQRATPLESPGLAAEANYLRAAIALRVGDRERALAEAETLDDESGWRYYFDYNMGAALAANGQWLQASEYFRRLSAVAPGPDRELLSLRDRALAASGYALMAAAQPGEARADFQQVRLSSEVSDRALLGDGWAALENRDYLAALAPWQALSQRPPVNQSVRESLLAIPYAYEQLERPGLALNRYRQASGILEREIAEVRRAIALFESGDLETLLDLRTLASEDWLFGEDILPLSEQAPYLKHLIASHEFQGAMKEMRDLQRISQRLLRSRDKLDVLAAADGEQQAAWSSVIEGGGRQALVGRLQDLRSRIDRASADFAQAERDGDGRALADPERQAQWQRIERAEANATVLDATTEKRELLRLYRGLLTWDDSEQYPDRRWRAQRELKELHALLSESESRLAELDTTISRRQTSNFAPRIAELGDRVAGQQQEVALALSSSENQLRQVAVNELQQQSRAMQHALGQSRLAIARLYDASSTGATP